MDITKKREKEKKTIRFMIEVYCRGRHAHKKELCKECQSLLEYAQIRTEKCPFMENKTFCSACKVHCYSKEMQARIQEVMRYSGPRMLLYHPFQAFAHMWVTAKGKIKTSGRRKMNKRKVIDKLLIISIVVMAVSGFLIRPTGELMVVLAMHKLSAVLFCVLGIAHALQYKRRRGKQDVSQKIDQRV